MIGDSSVVEVEERFRRSWGADDDGIFILCFFAGGVSEAENGAFHKST